MAGLEDILKALPIDQIAAQLGVAPQVAADAVRQGGGAILSGLQQNAATPAGSSAIEAALGNHVNTDAGNARVEDGTKILGHVFGGQEQQVAEHLTKADQTAGIDFGKLLPMIAPVIMGVLAKGQQSQAPQAQASGGGIGDLIGGLLGGGQQGGGGIDLGGLLGGLLGGKKYHPSHRPGGRLSRRGRRAPCPGSR